VTQLEISDSDIAIVGMSGRFPGAADIAGLWRLICAGQSGITRFGEQELLAAGVSPQALADPGYVRAGAVIDGIAEFDAGFFGVGPKEAQILDPQQRLYLEHNWQALEDAGCDPSRFAGAIGVFGGSAWSSYLQNNLMPAGAAAEMGELVVGLANDKDSLTTRVAHTLGLTGPAYSVQSYCSTSLVAVCAAATSLANFECDMALAGGVNVQVPHRVGYLYSQGGIAPPDGECRAFDAAGLGAPVGSGVGVVALRRLSDALADGDRVYAVIRGWAVNNDGGRKVGFTAPGVQGQAAVIAEALSSADLGPADIDYIEAHGTGTALGDASELAALQQVFRGQSCLIGSVKTNLGHLDRAAGVTGLIKATLAVQSGQLPPSRNLVQPNEQLHAGEAELEVVTELRGWPQHEQVRRAGVSAFGIGGTNAHVVLEQAPPADRPAPSPRPELLIWSGRDVAGAQARTDGLAEHLGTAEDRLCDVAYTLQTGRRVFEHRRMLVATDRDEALTALREGSVLSGVEARTDRPVGFLIAGTGEQYPGMAADLYRSEPVFREVLDECRSVLMSRLGGLDPLEEMLSPRNPAAFSLGQLLGREELPADSQDEATERIQPASFAVQYALAQLLRSWGVEPAILAGYSIGEYVAACLAGVLTLDAALALVARRAQLIAELPAGAMAAVSLPLAELERTLERSRITGLDVAAVNGREVTVVSGEPAALAQFRVFLEGEGAVCRPLATRHAFHSRMLAPVKAQLTDWIAEHVPLAAPRLPYLSNVTGTLATAEQVTDPAYWAEHMCSPVQFETMLTNLLANEDLALLELGPGQSLGALARAHADCAPHRWRQIVPCLPAATDPRPAGIVLAEAVGRLWLAGVGVDWRAYQADRPVGKVGLPGYPFQRSSYWIDRPATAAAVAQPVPDARPAPHIQLLSPRWRPAAAGTVPQPSGQCVLLTGRSAGLAGLTGALAERLRDAGVQVSTAEQVADLTASTAAGGRRTVLDLRLLADGHSARPSLDAHSDQPDDDGRAAVLAIAALADACGSQGTENTAIVLVTRGGQVVAAERPLPAHAAAAALAAVVNQEYLNIECRTVDLDPAGDQDAVVAALVAELANADPDVLTGYRGGRRLVREFGPVDSGRPAVAVRPGGSYLITGGLGDVGLTLAEHLIGAGAGRLVLTSRSGLPLDPAHPRAQAVTRLRELAEVLTPALDCTDPAGLRALLADIRPDGVIHAAADVGRDTFRPLRDLDADAVEAHFAAKVTGGRLLAELIAELAVEDRPDFCVLFSSTSAMLGGLAFGSYAAANAALTAIGQRQADDHRTAWIAASWDTWADTIQRSADGVGGSMLAHSMTTAEGLAAFDGLLADPGPSVLVAAAGIDDRLPKLAADLVPVAVPVSAGQRFPRPELPQPYSPPLTDTERALAELWSGVLGVQPVGTRDNFFDLSGNSLLALQMLKLVKDQFGIAVPAVALFESPTVQSLAALLDRSGAVVALVQPAQPRQVAPLRSDPDLDRQIAVVGMAGRFPGAADVASFWQNITGGVESISFFSEQELLAAGVDPATIADPSYVPARPVLDDVSGFDAAFFGISPRMAAITDPQQRLFLEVCWEALEQAGYGAPEYRDRVGVYGGCNISTYLLQMPEEAITGGDVSTYEIIMGNDKDALTTTVSYLFDLSGPSVAVQTFCSTSLVATHLAIQSLRNGECELALAGGVSIRVPDRIGHIFGPGGQESPDGHVRTFDAQAKGSMFGDGAAVVVLKRLSDALRDGDHIWSVIRGSAMNNDGALKVGYTAPSVVGQSRVVVDALADAGVTGEDISYIEAHGTATELGDPIEIAALTRAFGETSQRQYCPIGSVKTNIGHLDRAAGVTGLIKTSMSLRDGLIPASLHYTSPNPQIDFDNSPFYVNAVNSPWRTRDGRRPLAGINSLGMGGTNVHVVVEQAPARERVEPAADSGRRYQVLPVSARNVAAADQACGRLAEHLAAAPESRLLDVAYTLQVGRKTFEHRRVLVTDSLPQAATGLTGPGLLSRVDTVRGRQTAFLFTGVGEQYPGMVGELYRREPVFRAELDACLGMLQDGLLADRLPDAELADLLTGARGDAAPAGSDGSRTAVLERTEIAQPLLFAVEYALARALMSWGVQPRVMFGYSLGEYVAACLAGVLSLPDALALVAHRASLISTVEPGAMVAVSLSAAELQRRFRLAERELDIAAANGPQVTVVAGPTEVVTGLIEQLRRAEVPCRQLRTTHAFHSRMLAGIGAELTDWISRNITLNPPTTRYISNVTGNYADAELVCNPGYWAQHMCATVQFADAASTLLADPELAVVEIGPGQSLGALIRAAGAEPRQWPLILSTLPAAADRRPDDAALADCIARLWLLGVDLDWLAYHDRRPGAVAIGSALPGRVPLPTYPFQRQRYWIEGAPRGTRPALPAGESSEITFDTIASLAKLPEDQWLHLPVWRQTAGPASSVEQPGNWLVYARDGLAGAVVSELTRAGTAITLVRPGDGYAEAEDGFTLRPGNAEDTLAMLRAQRAAGRPLDRVLHLWALDAPEELVVAEGLHTLVALARAAGELGMDDWSLDVVVAGTQQVLSNDVTRPHAATVTGPCRVIPLEYPDVSTRLIDLDPDPGPAAVTGLLAELRRAQTEPLVALRHGRRWLPGYETMQPPAGEPAELAAASLREGGVYLVTGGLGGIGLAMADRLARDCQAKLVLLGRHGLPARDSWPALLAGDCDERTRRQLSTLTAWQDAGAEVEVVTGDVSSPDDVRRAVELALDRFGALHGVLHVAGVPAMGLMQFKQPSELDQVLAPKVAGALAISDALRIGKPDEIELDFLLLFSSITSATGGGPGQVDYCAANAFLDSYACQLAATGRRVLSVDWGEWTWNAWEEGLGGYADVLQSFFRENRARIGIDFDEGWRSLLRVLACPEPRVVVSTQDFPTMVRYSSKFTVAAVTSPALSDSGGSRHPRPELVTAYQEPTGEVEQSIAEIWCNALRLQQLGVADNFFELGGNSLLGVSIVAELRKRFDQVELPPHILYEAPTVAALAEVILGAASSTDPADGDGDSHVRAQLRRSGLQASAGRRRTRSPDSPTTSTEVEQS
jgi:acyl transferase domain-containing protein/acyl carrier protein